MPFRGLGSPASEAGLPAIRPACVCVTPPPSCRWLTTADGVIGWGIVQQLRAMSFPTVPGTVIRSEIVSGRSDDGMTYTFKVRDGITFHSGNPLTAADAVFSLRGMLVKVE